MAAEVFAFMREHERGLSWRLMAFAPIIWQGISRFSYRERCLSLDQRANLLKQLIKREWFWQKAKVREIFNCVVSQR